MVGESVGKGWKSKGALTSIKPRPALPAEHASFLFSCLYLAALGSILWICYRKRWFLKL